MWAVCDLPCSAVSAAQSPYLSPGAAQREKQYRAHREFGDRRDKVISARTYFYADETKCDQHMDTFLRCIEASGRCPACATPRVPLCLLCLTVPLGAPGSVPLPQQAA